MGSSRIRQLLINYISDPCRIEENIGEFDDSLQIHHSFSLQLLIVSDIAIEAGLKFAKVYFAKCILASNSPKFCPAKVSVYTVFNYSSIMLAVSPLVL